ncbi:M23 family metallopeptidase [Bacillus toyonensis]|uniref:M23 family metallopeptidase n=1 Tax=Bacillus toyonensis TaxID=155322 RepID=UPI000BEBF173|nr:M23 family metallopeptidase [Bacillus toyonensis]PDY49800.1 hypothetical protein CON61_28795 [Bacillus toyonensis]
MTLDKNIPSPSQANISFEIDISAAVNNSGYTGGLGGPNQGGHHGQPDWYNKYGMDIGAAEGTEVYAAFDAHITKVNPHIPGQDRDGKYGAQIFMRAPNDMMGGFYTHLTGVPAGIAVGTTVSRGDLLGRVYRFGSTSPHLHLALVEIIGGAPGGQYVGVDLYQLFLKLELTDPGKVVTVKFWQDGSAPTIRE